MKRRRDNSLIFWILLSACSLPFVYAACTGQEEFLLLGLLPALFFIITLIVLKARSRQFQRILRREGHLLYFEYDSGEAEEIIAHEMPKIKKSSYGLALLFAICLMIIFTPFALMMYKSNPSTPVWAVFATAVLIPVLGAMTAQQAAAGKVRKSPCITAVGHDYILIANCYPGINDYSKLKLDHASISQEQQNSMLYLRLSYSFSAMRNTTRIQKTVDVPVPRDKRTEANAFVLTYAKQGTAAAIHPNPL